MEKLYVYTGYTQSTTDTLQIYIEAKGFKVVNIVYGNDKKRSRKIISPWFPQSEYDHQQLVNVSTKEADIYDEEYFNRTQKKD